MGQRGREREGEGSGRPPLRARWGGLTRAQKALTTVGTAAGLAVVGWSVNWGMPKLVDWINPPFEAPGASRLLIVDTSASMSGPVGRRKFDRAVAEIGRHIANTPDVALALRTAGGGCTVGYEEPVVGFESGNADSIQAELEDVRPSGEANIVAQLEQGTNDFHRFRGAKSADVQSIWLFLASGRDCSAKDEPLGEAIRAALVDSPAKVSYVDFFVLRGDRRSYARLKRSMEAMGASFRVKRVANGTQLRRAMQDTELSEAPSE